MLDVLGLVEDRVLEQDVRALREHVTETERERDREDCPQDQADPPAVHRHECIAYTGLTKRSFKVGNAFAATALVLIGGFVFAQLARAGEPLALDQGLFACFGRWLRDGWLPYRDIFDSKPPLHLYTWVLAWAGGSPGSAWLFEALWLAASCTLAFAVARRRQCAWAGLAGAAMLFLGLWAPGLGGYWSRLQAEELLLLPELAAAWFALTSNDRPRAALACGVLTGAVGLYKIPGLAVAGAWVALWIASAPRDEHAADRRWLAIRIGYLAAGIALPWLVASAWFAVHGAFGAFVDATVFYQRHWIAMIDPPWRDVLAQFATTLVHALAPLGVAAIAGLALAWRRDRAYAICLVAWIVLDAIAILLQRQLAGYHFLLLVPPLALAAGSGIAALGARLRSAIVPAAVALSVIALLLAGTLRDWTRAYGAGDLRSYDRGQFSPADERAVADYLAAHTDPADGVLVWALAPGIYALADRHPVTRFPFHRLLYTDSPLAHAVPGRDARRAALLDRMRVDPPAYIVLGIKDANPFEPDSFTSLLGFGELHAIVQRDYHDETRIGHFVLLARNR